MSIIAASVNSTRSLAATSYTNSTFSSTDGSSTATSAEAATSIGSLGIICYLKPYSSSRDGTKYYLPMFSFSIGRYAGTLITSIRSMRGPSMLAIELLVQMKMVWEKSNSMSR